MKQIDDIAKELNLDNLSTKVVQELLVLNNGRLNAAALRAHLSMSYSSCSRLLDALVEQNLAVIVDDNEHLQSLETRERGWLKNT